mgnify:FL=1
MNIPALLEIDTDSEWDGRQAIVDGYTGTLYIDPDEEVKKNMRSAGRLIKKKEKSF